MALPLISAYGANYVRYYSCCAAPKTDGYSSFVDPTIVEIHGYLKC